MEASRRYRPRSEPASSGALVPLRRTAFQSWCKAMIRDRLIDFGRHVVARAVPKGTALPPAAPADLAPLAPAGSHFRACVDTAPLLEREIAARAGLGFIGKNGLLIVPGLGSHVVLGELLTDVALAPTVPPVEAVADRCGTCTACLEGCPTSAFVAPRVVDSRRCLSYLTIEKRGAFSEEEASSLDGRLFGCDVCQDVCPFNQAVDLGGTADDGADLDPEEVAALDDTAFASRFGHTAISRATAEGLRRNARAALALPGAPR